MRDPYASMMLNGIKTLETRNHQMLVNVEGFCLLHIGRQTMAEAEAGLFLWNQGYASEDIDALTKPPRSLERGSVLGLVELGKTRLLDEAERGLEEMQQKVGSEAVGLYATEVHRAWWLERPIAQKGAPGVWKMRVDPHLLPPDALAKIDGGSWAREGQAPAPPVPAAPLRSPPRLAAPTRRAERAAPAAPAAPRRAKAAAPTKAAAPPAAPAVPVAGAEAGYLRKLPTLPPMPAPKDASSSAPAAQEGAGSSKGSLEDPGRLPKLIVFDLDGVCWSPEMYQTKGGPPYKLLDGGAAVVNSAGETIQLYEAVQRVWALLHGLPSVRVAVASSSRREKAVPLLRKLTVAPGVRMADVLDDGLFEMYYVRGEGKRPHLAELLRKTGLSPDEVLFVDDSADNIRSVQELGVVAVHLPKGLTEWAWEKALGTYHTEVGEG